MEHYNFYRRYRPQTFADVVGQQTIVKTLENAIKTNKISHAYLFNGPRGTGKTSIAKIFSKEINNFNDNAEHPDIWEMDAASNNGVDEVRRIIENVSFVPIEAKYKVYIIDEVHMLSKGAFNALLKTLEDPPNYVVFILATTEIHKIPITVISRCQRFDFQRILETDISKAITKVLDQEQISYESQAVSKISQLADGSLRDALSLLEKVITYDPKLTMKSVCECFNIVNQEQLFKLISYTINGDVNNCLKYFDQLYETGIDGKRLVEDLEQLVKQLIIEHNHPQLQHIIKDLNELLQTLNYSNNVKLTIEVYLIQMCDIVNKYQITALDLDVYKPKDNQDQVFSEDVDLSKDFTNFSTINPTEDYLTTTPLYEEVVEEEVVEPELEVETLQPVIKQTKTIGEESITNDMTTTPEVETSVSDTTLDLNSVTHMVEPSSSSKSINLDDLISASQDISLMDVLSSATKNDKVALASAFYQIKQMLEEHQKFGIAKFFEKANVHACGSCGCVLSLNQDDYPIFVDRVDDINQVLINARQCPFKVYLMTYSDWESNKEYYRQQVKVFKEQDLYNNIKTKFSGFNIIKKTN